MKVLLLSILAIFLAPLIVPVCLVPLMVPVLMVYDALTEGLNSLIPTVTSDWILLAVWFVSMVLFTWFVQKRMYRYAVAAWTMPGLMFVALTPIYDPYILQ